MYSGVVVGKGVLAGKLVGETAVGTTVGIDVGVTVAVVTSREAVAEATDSCTRVCTAVGNISVLSMTCTDFGLQAANNVISPTTIKKRFIIPPLSNYKLIE